MSAKSHLGGPLHKSWIRTWEGGGRGIMVIIALYVDCVNYTGVSNGELIIALTV